MVTRSSAPPALESHPPRQHEYLLLEDEMGDSVAQTVLLTYLGAVLAHLYRETGWFVARNLSFYHVAVRNSQNLISPDIAVFVGLALPPQEQRRVTSWEMRPTHGQRMRPAPTVVFQVSSGSTWKTDIAVGKAYKPWLYGQMGPREYFAYDPNNPPVWRNSQRQRLGRRLLGWRYDAGGLPVALEPDAQGRLWSTALDSWLQPDEDLLRLYDATGTLRVTPDEAAAMQASVAAALAQSERRARLESEQRVTALEAELRRLRGASG